MRNVEDDPGAQYMTHCGPHEFSDQLAHSLSPTASMTVSTLLIEGSFPELAEELAQYFDSIEDTGLLKEIEPLLQETRETADSDQARIQDEILKKLVQKAPILNNVSERGRPDPSL